jgi:hypothetical protein
MMESIRMPEWKPCPCCGDDVPNERVLAGYNLCMPCGEARARERKHIVQIPFSKGAYQYIHNPQDLRITNPKPR